MRSLTLLAFATLLLAGCSGTAPTDTTTAPQPSSTAPAPTTSKAAPTTTAPSPTAAPPANHPPAIAAFAAERQAATTLAFNFTFSGSDADADSLAWTLDADGDGSADANGASVPGRVPFTYPSGGVYQAKLTLSDGKASDERTLSVNATLAPSGPLQTFSVKWQVGAVWCQPYPYLVPPGLPPQVPAPVTPTPYKSGTQAAGVLYGEANLTAALSGKPFAVGFGAPASPMDQGVVAFYDSADAFLGSFASGFTAGPPPAAANPMLVSGTVPAGAAKAVLWNCGNPEGLTVQLVVG